MGFQYYIIIYSFYFKIVDIEVTDVPPVECAGDTFATGTACHQTWK